MSSSAWQKHLVQDRLIGLLPWAPIRILPKGKGGQLENLLTNLCLNRSRIFCTECHAVVDLYIVILIFFLFIFGILSHFSQFVFILQKYREQIYLSPNFNYHVLFGILVPYFLTCIPDVNWHAVYISG
jgi:hypothetical protein